MVGDAVPVERELDHAAVVVETLEEDVASARERELDDSEPDSLDVVVRGEEPAPEVLAERFQRAGAELERGDVDEVLHRVGRDDHRVVAGRVRRSEVVAEDVELDLCAPQLSDAIAPVDAHLGLAVVDPHPFLQRSRAMATSSPSAVSSSSSRERGSRPRSTWRISLFGRPSTKTTKRKP